MLFDGSRRDRLRRFGYAARYRTERWGAGFDFSLWALPLPYVRVRLDEQTLGVAVGVGTNGLSDDVIAAWADVKLPGPIADAADWLLPDEYGRSAWCQRTPDVA